MLSKGQLDFNWRLLEAPTTDPGGRPGTDRELNYDIPL